MTTQPTPGAGGAPFPLSASAARKQALGAYGETLAARHLVAAGMVLLDRNWRGPSGEIDLVLRDRGVLVVCEVKTRTTDDYGTPHEAVDDLKLGRLRRLAAEWLRVHDAHPHDVRIDLVAVRRPRRGPSEVEHVRGLG
jgi:putative endonuclease